MNKNSILLAVATLFITSFAHAERVLIDPSKVETLRCDDTTFKNEPYELIGPQQQFVFSGADGITHHFTFEGHEECLSKMNFVKHAQKDSNHPWVAIDTNTFEFAMIDHVDAATRVISSEHK